MMDKYIARDLLPLVNDIQNMAALVAYANDRLANLSKDLESTADINTILRLQGQIKELRRIHTLKDEANLDSRKE